MLFSVKDRIELITAIEENFDVNAVQCNGVKIWPLIRVTLSFLLDSSDLVQLQHKRYKSQCNSQLRFTDIRHIYVQNNRIWQSILYPLKLLDPSDALILSRHETHSEKIGDSFVDRCTDPILECLRGQGSKYLKLELDTPNGRQKQPRLESTTFINTKPCLIKENLFRRCFLPFEIKEFEALRNVVLKVTGVIDLNKDKILDDLYLLEGYTALFRDLLSSTRFKATFISCSEYIVAMALMRVCKEIGVQSIEVQHGIQGKYHSQYAYWTRIPYTGYELLPDHFWVWSEQCKKDIMETRPPLLGNHSHHLPIVGGNPWLGRWLKEDVGLSEAGKSFLNQLQQYRKVILVSLQSFNSLPELLDLLAPAMQEAAGSWFLLIRFHPLHQGEREVKRVLSTLQNYGLTNFEIEFSTQMPLYSILKRCDYHLTQSSTVCHEATAFGVKTGIIDPDKTSGYCYYQEKIECGEFDHISNSQNILDKVSSSFRTPSIQTHLKSAYINPDPALAQQIISNLCKH